MNTDEISNVIDKYLKKMVKFVKIQLNNFNMI